MLFVFNRLKQIRSAWEHGKAWNINGFSADGGETGVDVELKTFEEGLKKKKKQKAWDCIQSFCRDGGSWDLAVWKPVSRGQGKSELLKMFYFELYRPGFNIAYIQKKMMKGTQEENNRTK